MFQRNDQCFMEVFRGECNFIESSGVSAWGEKKRHVLTTGGRGRGTDIIGNSLVYREAF